MIMPVSRTTAHRIPALTSALPNALYIAVPIKTSGARLVAQDDGSTTSTQPKTGAPTEYTDEGQSEFSFQSIID